jgi:hypothetical protein
MVVWASMDFNAWSLRLRYKPVPAFCTFTNVSISRFKEFL